MDTNFVLIQASIVFNQQMSLFDDNIEDTKEGRNKAFRELFDTIIERKTIKAVSNGTENLIIYRTKLNKDLLYLQLARRKKIETYQLNNAEKDLINIPVDNYPPLDVFVNLAKQQFAIEYKTYILSLDAIISALNSVFRRVVKQCSVFFNTVDNISDFWSVVDKQEGVKEISFDLTVPNIFGASDAAKQLVDGAKNDLNADSISIGFKNEKGQLSANFIAMDSFVKYASRAGSWKLKIKKAGESKYKVIHSSDFSVKKTLDSSVIDLVKKVDSSGNIETQYLDNLIVFIEELFKDEM